VEHYRLSKNQMTNYDNRVICATIIHTDELDPNMINSIFFRLPVGIIEDWTTRIATWTTWINKLETAAR